MTDEPKIEEISEDGNEPATKRDVALVKEDVAAVRREIAAVEDSLRGEMTALRSELTGKMNAMKDEILRHFDAAVEIIEDSLRGANADEISMLKDHDEQHDDRIRTLEEPVGLR